MLKPMDFDFAVDINLEAPKYTSGTYSASFELKGTKFAYQGTVKVEGNTVLYTIGGKTDKAVYNTGAGTYVSTPV